jgi:Holliday junction resolvasome RuvABC endonuclease subunit
MLTLGLDPSLRSYGWCVYDSEALNPRSRLVASGHEGTLPMTVPVARFMHFRSLVASLLRRFEVDVVGIESPAFSGGPFSENHFGLMMFSLEAAFERRKDCVLFDPTTLKYLVGKSTYGKMDMQRFVQLDTMSSQIIDNNEADAYCIARFASRFMQIRSGRLKPKDLTKNELSVFLTRSKKKKRNDGFLSFKKTAHVFRENSRFFEFSRVPVGSVTLPTKSDINPMLIQWLESNLAVKQTIGK